MDAYYENLPPGVAPRIMASRTAFVADEPGRGAALRRARPGPAAGCRSRLPDSDLDQRIAAFDVHVGTPQDVIDSLRADPTLERVTDLVFQVHSVDPPHPLILRSIELLATEVAPALGWTPRPAATEWSTT